MPCRDSAARIPKDGWYVAWTSIMSDTSGVWILLDCWAGCKHNEPPATSINYAPVNSFRIHACARIHTHVHAHARVYVHTSTVHERGRRLYACVYAHERYVSIGAFCSPDILAACTYVPDRPAALTPDLSTDGMRHSFCLISWFKSSPSLS